MRNRDWLLKATFGIAACAAAAGCVPTLNDPDYGPLFDTFAVSDIFSPSGFMGDGANPGYLTVDFDQSHCKQPRPQGARGNCYTFTYYMDPGAANLKWAGVYWVYPTNSWGSRPGYHVIPTAFKQVRFSAALQLPSKITKSNGGNTFFNAIAGGINGKGFYGPQCPTVYDRYVTVNVNAKGEFVPDGSPEITGQKTVRCEHDDKFRAEEVFQIGTDIGTDYKPFHVSLAMLANQPVDEIVGAFAWSIDFPSDSCSCDLPGVLPDECAAMNGRLNCPEPVKIYIDDIVWDTAPLPTP